MQARPIRTVDRGKPARAPAQAGRAARSLEASAPVFAALGDVRRLQLVSRLCAQGPQSIARLTEEADVTRQAITKHLRVLESAGIVRVRRDEAGRARLWELAPRRLEAARIALALVSTQWDSAMGRLRSLVERPEVE
jgi:DNA-binding transcriptional ArsR family regulator